jgi:hypothetical protein
LLDFIGRVDVDQVSFALRFEVAQPEDGLEGFLAGDSVEVDRDRSGDVRRDQDVELFATAEEYEKWSSTPPSPRGSGGSASGSTPGMAGGGGGGTRVSVGSCSRM